MADGGERRGLEYDYKGERGKSPGRPKCKGKCKSGWGGRFRDGVEAAKK